MLERYRSILETLSVAELELVADRLRTKRLLNGGLPDCPTPEELYEHCQAAHLMQADIVVALASEDSFQAKNVVEKLIGRPVHQLPPQVRPETKPVSVTALAAALKHSKDPRLITRIHPNPKRPGTGAWRRYNLYRENMTVGQYRDLGGEANDIRYDVWRGFITLRDP